MLALLYSIVALSACLFGPLETPAKAKRASRADLLAMMPSDTALAVAVNFRDDVISEELIRKAASFYLSQQAQASLLADTLVEIPSDMVFGFVPSKRRDRDADVVVVMDISDPRFDFRDWLTKQLLPLIRATNPHNNKAHARLEGQSPIFTITMAGEEKPLLYIAVRGKIAVASTESRLVKELQSKKKNKRDSFASVPGVRRIMRSLPTRAAAWVVVQPQPFVAAQEKPKPRSREELLMQVLSPADLHAAAAYLDMSDGAIELGALVLLSDESHGVAQLLTGPHSESALLGNLAAEFPLSARVACDSLCSLPATLYRITDQFDQTIGIEYREDLATFQKQTGVNFNSSLLGQVHQEIIFGLRPDFSQQPPIAWTLAMPVQDPTVFAAAAEKLTQHFGLTYETREQAGLRIHTSTDMTPIAWTLAGPYLVIANSAKTVRDTAQALSRPSTKKTSLGRSLQKMGVSNQFFLNVDIKMVSQQAPMLAMLAGPKFGPLIQDGYLAASMTRDDRFSRFRLRWEPGKSARPPSKTGSHENNELMSLVGAQAIDAMISARREAQRVLGMSNMRGMTQGLYIYASDHGGQFPESLAELIKSNNLTLEMFKNPYTGDGPTGLDDFAELSHLIYRPGLTTKAPPEEIIIAERVPTPNGNGIGVASIAFADGHIEAIEDPLASKLIEMIELKAPSVTIAAAEAELAGSAD